MKKMPRQKGAMEIVKKIRTPNKVIRHRFVFQKFSGRYDCREERAVMKVKFQTIGIRSSEDALKDAAEAMQSII
jgi:hypothetical protein